MRTLRRRTAWLVVLAALTALTGMGAGAMVPARSDAIPATGVLISANLRDASITAMDPATGARLATWAAPHSPHELALGAEGLLVTDYRADALLTLGAAGQVRATSTPGRPHGIAADAAGAAWITTAGDGAIHRQTAAGLADGIVVGDTPHALVIDGARSVAYVAVAGSGEVVAVDLAAGRILARQAVGALAESLALSADGIWIAVAAADAGTVSILEAATLTVRHTLATGDRPVRVAFAGGAVLASLSRQGAVLAIDAASGARIGSVRVGRLPDGISVDAAGRYAFVASPADGAISVIALDTLTVRDTLPTPGGPSGLLWLPALP